MLRDTVRWALASALFLGLFAGQASRADEAEAKAAIAKLLEVGWATTPQARTAADLQYQEVQKLAPGDANALTASLLVLMQQRRYDEAHKRLEELLAKDTNNPTTLRAYVWVAIVRKNYSSSMLAASKLSETLAAAPPKTPAEEAVHEELITFLGRIYGYLGGPVADVASQDQRKLYEKQALARLGDSQRPLLEEARDSVLQKFIELTDAKSDDRDKAIADASAAKEKTLQEIESDRQKSADRVNELRDERAKVESEVRAEMTQIAKEDAPLVQRLAQLNGQATALSATLFNYENDILRLQGLANSTKDPNLKQQYLFDAQQVSFAASRIQGQLAGVNGLAAGVQNQRAGLAARGQRAQAAANDHGQRLERELQDIAKREKKNAGIEKRTERPAAGTTSKGRALTAQATALSTYDQFPLELVRQQLLESLR